MIHGHIDKYKRLFNLCYVAERHVLMALQSVNHSIIRCKFTGSPRLLDNDQIAAQGPRFVHSIAMCNHILYVERNCTSSQRSKASRIIHIAKARHLFSVACSKVTFSLFLIFFGLR
jgi:hypothetical protein